MQPTIALIGRPNVGKSTLFNRIIGRNRAITHNQPGVTRDRMYGNARRGGKRFRVVDTGGIALNRAGQPGEGPEGIRGFEAEVLMQARKAMDESQVLLLILDGREGLLPLDEQLAQFLRQGNKPVLAVINKVDGEEQEERLAPEFHALGLDLVPVSGAHGYNLQALFDAMAALLPEAAEPGAEEAEAGSDGDGPDIDGPGREEAEQGLEYAREEGGSDPDEPARGGALETEALGRWDENEAEVPLPEDEPLAPGKGLRLALLGRPNAGKSSLINALAGEERMIVSEIPGTTRDSVDVTINAPDGREYVFVDTAGVRRKSKITDTLERYSVHASLTSSKKAQVTLLVLDAAEGVTQQDKRLIALLDKEKTPFLVLVNKIDLVPKAMLKEAVKDFAQALNICAHVPVLYISARTGRGVDAILGHALALWGECGLRVSTGQLNRAMTEALAKHQPPVVKGKRAKFYYMTQTGVRPPTFVLFVNDPARVKDSYVRYLENRLRGLFGLSIAPIRLLVRESGQDLSRRLGRSRNAKPRKTGAPPCAEARQCGARPRSSAKSTTKPATKPAAKPAAGPAARSGPARPGAGSGGRARPGTAARRGASKGRSGR